MYIWKNTQFTNNHVRKFRSMPFPNRALRSNLATLVWLVVPVWNPIALFLSYGLGSSQVVEAWWYTRPAPSPWKACAPRKETKVGQTPLGFPILFVGNQGSFSCFVIGLQEFNHPICEKPVGWGLWWCVLEPTTKLRMVEGWATRCA